MVRKAAAILSLCCLTNALLAQPRPPGFRPHYKAFCVVDGQGRARCVRFEDLNRLLSPGQIQKLQNLVDELFPQLSTRTGAARNTIADCSGDRWVRADLSIPPSTPAGPMTGVPGSTRKKAPFPSAADAAQLLAQCRSAVQGWLGSVLKTWLSQRRALETRGDSRIPGVSLPWRPRNQSSSSKPRTTAWEA
jgi:hypothetical protein